LTIKTATFKGVATIEIARPEKKNALTQAMYCAMAEALIAANSDTLVRAVLITGQPGCFTSGNDIEDFMQTPPGQDGKQPPVARFMHALLQCEKPVVVAVTGAAVGIGTTMLLHCDLVYVSDEARLAMPSSTAVSPLNGSPSKSSSVALAWPTRWGISRLDAYSGTSPSVTNGIARRASSLT